MASNENMGGEGVAKVWRCRFAALQICSLQTAAGEGSCGQIDKQFSGTSNSTVIHCGM
jgi:hypothetical protein